MFWTRSDDVGGGAEYFPRISLKFPRKQPCWDICDYVSSRYLPLNTSELEKNVFWHPSVPTSQNSRLVPDAAASRL